MTDDAEHLAGADPQIERRCIVLNSFVAASATIAAISLVMTIAILAGVRIEREAFMLPLRAYAGNPNAFAVQMVISAAAAIGAYHLGAFGQRRYILPLVLSLIAAAVYLSHSRAGLVMFTLAVMLMMTFPMRMRRRDLLPALLWPMIAMACSHSLPWIFGDSEASVLLKLLVIRESGDLERWISIVEGWEMWLRAPLFGEGLGAYMQYRLSTTGSALIIHSVPVWLLAETGLAGFGIVTAVFIVLVRQAYRGVDRFGDAWAMSLLIALLCIGIGCLVHDFFFQRSLWFLIGLLMVAPMGLPARKMDRPALT